jgi:type IV pilus assembly protein PilO
MTGNLRKVVFLVLLISVAAVGYQYMIKPANAHLSEIDSRVTAKEAQLAKFKEATVAVEGLSKQLDELQKAMGFFESKLPPTSQIHEVLQQVTVIAQKEGLKPKTIRTLNRKDNSGYIEQPLKMELEGNFSAFYSFLLELEKLPRIMKIRELQLGRTKDKDSDGQIAADFTVSIFFQNVNG